MSTVKFECPPYKLWTGSPYQQPIIVGVDDRLESPETFTSKYEEAVARASRGDLSGDSPPSLLPMPGNLKSHPQQMHGYDTGRGYQDHPYTHYTAQPFPSEPQENGASQINQHSFAANSAVSHYVPVVPTVLSCQPASGPFGSKVLLRVASEYDLLAVGAASQYVLIVFGSEKCPAEVVQDSREDSGFTYNISADAPQFLVTGCRAPNVPLSLLIEGPGGEEISRTGAGQFLYHDAQVGGAGGSPEDVTGKDTKSPVRHHPDSPPKSAATQVAHEPATNTYEYPDQSQQAAEGPYGNDFPQGDNNMITAYRSASFTEQHYPRAAPPALRPPTTGWPVYGAMSLDTGRSPIITHASLSRPILSPLPVPTGSTPQLIRTSTMQSGSAAASHSSTYNPYALYPSKAVLNIVGKLDTMALNWTPEEWTNRRRIVLFKKTQSGTALSLTFRPVSVNERPPNSICISCIWWEEKRECYVTSVDTIHLLEQLVAAPTTRFTVEEKNRIRRNLEGFHPLTVSKAKRDSEEFFKLIMSFPNPKPRNIEKDVKVYSWKVLEAALKKIIGKYSASPAALLPATQLMTPVSTSTYPPLPTPPGVTTATDAVTAYAVQHQSHHDNMASPRSISGHSGSWVPYTAPPTRTLSPIVRHSPSSPQSTVRLTNHPTVSAYDTRPITTSSYSPALHAPLSHPSSASASARWDALTSTYGEAYPSLTASHGQSHQIYSTGAYGDGAPRA